jgi:arsenate reductase
MSAPDFPITIFHNPACGTSRNVVAMAKAAGYEPQVVEYLKAGWTKDQLKQLATAAGVPLREFLRDRGTPAAELGLLEPTATEDAILEAMVAHPILVNRPIMVTPKGTALCRPSERALDLLENQPEGA